MSWKEFLSALAIPVAILIVIVLLVPGGRLVAEQFVDGAIWLLKGTVYIVLNFLAVLTVFAGPFGMMVMILSAFEALDVRIKKDKKLTKFQQRLVGVVGVAFTGVWWLLVVPYLAKTSSWVLWVFRIFDNNFHGAYEIAPLGWGVFAAIAALIAWGLWSTSAAASTNRYR